MKTIYYFCVELKELRSVCHKEWLGMDIHAQVWTLFFSQCPCLGVIFIPRHGCPRPAVTSSLGMWVGGEGWRRRGRRTGDRKMTGRCQGQLHKAILSRGKFIAWRQRDTSDRGTRSTVKRHTLETFDRNCISPSSKRKQENIHTGDAVSSPSMNFMNFSNEVNVWVSKYTLSGGNMVEPSSGLTWKTGSRIGGSDQKF